MLNDEIYIFYLYNFSQNDVADPTQVQMTEDDLLALKERESQLKKLEVGPCLFSLHQRSYIILQRPSVKHHSTNKMVAKIVCC